MPDRRIADIPVRGSVRDGIGLTMPQARMPTILGGAAQGSCPGNNTPDRPDHPPFQQRPGLRYDTPAAWAVPQPRILDIPTTAGLRPVRSHERSRPIRSPTPNVRATARLTPLQACAIISLPGGPSSEPDRTPCHTRAIRADSSHCGTCGPVHDRLHRGKIAAS